MTFNRVLLILALLCGFVSWSFAGHKQNSVQQLRVQVKYSKRQLRRAKVRWQQTQAALKKVEKSVAVEAQALAKIQDKIRLNRRAITRLTEALQLNERRLAKQAAALRHSLQHLAVWLGQPPLKWVLSATSPSDLSRLLTYQRIISHAQQKQVLALRETQRKIMADKEAILQRQQVLQKQRVVQEKRLSSLRRVQHQRQALLVKLKRSIYKKSQQLQVTQASLQAAVNNLSRVSSGVLSGKFARARGRLLWPTAGRLVPLFGRPIEHSELKWNGVIFRAPMDQMVRSVAPGRVVYADWMAGYGWLLIINHDNGFMTLYGRNHYLYKKAGERVKRGEVIARVGRSGGFAKTGLYFAIRHDAKPLNPAKWLISKRRQVSSGSWA